MRRLIILAVLILVLILGGLATSMLAQTGGELLPVLRTVGMPEGSTSVLQAWKAEQLFLLIGFILFNLVGIGVTLAIVIWFLDRGVKHSQAEAASKEIVQS